MLTYISKSDKETKEIAVKLAKTTKGNVFALTGELGAGKTTFAQGFAKGLGIKEKIISPTFVLIKQYRIPNTDKIFYHIDLYRLEDTNHLNDLNLKDILNNKENVVLIEWAEKIEKLLPKKSTTWVSFKFKNNLREISII